MIYLIVILILVLLIFKKFLFTDSFTLNSVNDLIDSINPETGKSGPKGPLGDVGPIGEQGMRGVILPDFKKGPDGWMGLKGFRGETATGKQGPTGERGSMGEIVLPDGFEEKNDRIVFNKYKMCLGNKCYTEDDFKNIQGNENTLLIRNPNCDKCVTNVKGISGEVPYLQKCNKNQIGQNWMYNPKTFLLKNYDYNKCLSTNLNGDMRSNVNTTSINYSTNNQDVS